ncbi:MAG: flagellar basal body-associated FliL family protein [Thermohalobaculum sp.]|nr:flagellar basal body-associated FliL family protein [Thermohalobaculum sp.]
MSEKDGRKGRKGFLIAGLLSLLGGGGGAFYAVHSGMIPLPAALAEHAAAERSALDDWAAPSFVALEPLTVSLGPEARARHLRVALQLEVAAGAEKAVGDVVPRVVDVLNTFLRAVDEREFEMPRAMARLRVQMLRRVQLVAPPGAIRDVLIQEFVLS